MEKIPIEKLLENMMRTMGKYKAFGSLQEVLSDDYKTEKLSDNLRRFKDDIEREGFGPEEVSILLMIKDYKKKRLDDDDFDEFIDWDHHMMKFVIDVKTKQAYPVPKCINHSDFAILLALKNDIPLDDRMKVYNFWKDRIVGATAFFEEGKGLTALINSTGIENIMQPDGLLHSQNALVEAKKVLERFLSELEGDFPEKKFTILGRNL